MAERKKPNILKKVVVLAGAALGALVGWYYADMQHVGLSIVLGVIVGAFVADFVWDFVED